MITISFIGNIAEFVGAVLMVLPDNHEAIREVPLVLETPTEDGKSYAWNVDRVQKLRE